MTALVARLVAAIQQVRQETPHDATCEPHIPEHDWKSCTCDWAARVDARLAACVEAYGRAALERDRELLAMAHHYGIWARQDRSPEEAGLAAFLAAAEEGDQK